MKPSPIPVLAASQHKETPPFFGGGGTLTSHERDEWSFGEKSCLELLPMTKDVGANGEVKVVVEGKRWIQGLHFETDRNWEEDKERKSQHKTGHGLHNTTKKTFVRFFLGEQRVMKR